MTINNTSILAILDTLPSNAAPVPDLAVALGLSETVVQDAVGILVAAGLVSHDLATNIVALTKAEGDYVPEGDPTIDENIRSALASIFQEQGVSLSTFLNNLGAAGLSGTDARIGVYVARELALGIAARRGDDRLRGPLLKAAGLLLALSDAFTANAPAAPAP